MHLEEFAFGQSLWHRMDPRVKIVGLVFFAFAAALSKDHGVLAVALCVSVLSLALARLDVRQVLARFGAVNAFVLFLWFFLPFTTPGDVIAHLGPFAVHRQGIALGLAITLKANTVAAATMVLLGTSGIFDLVHALDHLKVPRRLVWLFFFTYRYVTVIHQEYSRLRTGMAVRCFRLRPTRHGLRSLANLVGMLLVRSFDRSERIYQAMVLRGFSGTFWTLDHFHMHRSDWVAAAAMAALVLGMIGWQIPRGPS